MKHLFFLLLSAMLLMPVINSDLNARNKNPYERVMIKNAKKAVKQRAKELQKEGWTVFNGTKTLELSLSEHLYKLEELGENGAEESGFYMCAENGKNDGRRAAQADAFSRYADKASAVVEGEWNLKGDIKSGAEVAGFSAFMSSYKSAVSKEIKGALRESFSLIRNTGRKNSMGQEIFEIQSFYIVNEEVASKARLRAMENAMVEFRMKSEYDAEVERSIREAFEE